MSTSPDSKTTEPLTAVVTGASSGIGRATAKALHAAGYKVLGVARREERLKELNSELGPGEYFSFLSADVSNPDDIVRIKNFVEEEWGGRLNSLVNVAGGALGIEPVAEANYDNWLNMYKTNTLGAAMVTKELLPALLASGRADVVFLTSTAGQVAYEGAAGYNAAKAGEHMVAAALRLELAGKPVRVIEIAPGMVHTEEFSLTRLGGDKAAADQVYAGVEKPLVAEDVADVIRYALQAPHHVNLDLITMRPLAQAAQHKLHRGPFLC